MHFTGVNNAFVKKDNLPCTQFISILCNIDNTIISVKNYELI